MTSRTSSWAACLRDRLRRLRLFQLIERAFAPRAPEPPDDGRVFLDDYHPNAEGHRIYASFLAENRVRLLDARPALPPHRTAPGAGDAP